MTSSPLASSTFHVRVTNAGDVPGATAVLKLAMVGAKLPLTTGGVAGAGGMQAATRARAAKHDRNGPAAPLSKSFSQMPSPGSSHGTGAEVGFPEVVSPQHLPPGRGRKELTVPTRPVSEIFDRDAWEDIPGFDLKDITYHRAKDSGTVRIAFNRPEVRNAFRPSTVDELYRALDHARQSSDVGCVLLTGNGPSAKDGGWAFCSGGDQRIRGKDGYRYTDENNQIDPARSGRRNSRGPAADPVHAQGRHLRRSRLGRRGWPQPARGRRSDHRRREHARFKQTTPMSQASTAGLDLHTWLVRSARSSPVRSSSWAMSTRPRTPLGWAW